MGGGREEPNMKSQGCGEPISLTVEQTPLGRVLIAASPYGIMRLDVLGDRDVAPTVRNLSHRLDAPLDLGGSELLIEAVAQLRAYLTGMRLTFNVPLDLRLAGPRLRPVLAEMTELPAGSAATVRQFAANATSTRRRTLVRAAIAVNPLPLLIPAHRIVGRGGVRREFSPGAEVQRYLLQLEAAVVRSRALDEDRSRLGA